jgi:hypothetical protein
MIHVHLLVPETNGHGLRRCYGFLRFLREFIEIHESPP